MSTQVACVVIVTLVCLLTIILEWIKRKYPPHGS